MTPEEEGKALEKDFAEIRIFNDERDLLFLDTRIGAESDAMCVIHKKSPAHFPELALDEDNLITVCGRDVKNAIQKFEKVWAFLSTLSMDSIYKQLLTEATK